MTDAPALDNPETRALETDLLVEAVYRRYGFDFRQYARASLERRLLNVCERQGIAHIAGLIPRVLHEPAFIDRLVNSISVNVTEPFRDPECFAAIRKQVFPVLATYPFFKIWHAGCASGEEVYSMAILLHEAGLLERAQLYATDINTDALARARDGIYTEEALARAEAGYQAAGGQGVLSDYYLAQYGSGRFENFLRTNMVFSQHNLVTDSAFGEMTLIMCRNVLIYFDRGLQDHVVRLFSDSLVHRGFLALGAKESLMHMPAGSGFDCVNRAGRLYRGL